MEIDEGLSDMRDNAATEIPDTRVENLIALPPHRLGLILGLTLYAVCFAGNTARTVPLGPYLSFTGDVLAGLAAVTAISLAMKLFRNRPLAVKIAAFVLIQISTISIAKIVISLILFCYRPHARGRLLGF